MNKIKVSKFFEMGGVVEIRLYANLYKKGFDIFFSANSAKSLSSAEEKLEYIVEELRSEYNSDFSIDSIIDSIILLLDHQAVEHDYPDMGRLIFALKNEIGYLYKR